MASVSGLNSTSSLYGNRNVITGLATGMDTESMIENAVSGLKLKITTLQQKRTKTEWRQEAYRSIIDKMSVFTDKYTSYTSSTNLLSAAFFNSAIKTVGNGTYANKIAAAGKTSSNLQILGVKQLATAASYTVSGKAAGAASADGNVIKGAKLDLNSAPTDVSKITGSLTIREGTRSFQIKFDENDKVAKNRDELLSQINTKLEQACTDYGVDSKAVTAVADGADGIKFVSKGGNEIYIRSASGDIASTLSVQTGEGSNTITVGSTPLYETPTISEQLKNKEISFTLDGVTKKITVGAVSDMDDLVKTLNDKLGDAFGEGKVTVSKNSGDGLSFTVEKGSSLAIGNGKVLGLASNSETSYVNTNRTLGELMKNADGTSKLDGLVETKEVDGKKYYAFNLNGVEIGQYTEDTSLQTILDDINKNEEAGVKVSYSRLTNQFQFTAKQTGEGSSVDFGDENSLGQLLFQGGEKKAGQDAVFTVSANGSQMELTRSSNVVELDGLTVTLKGTFNYDEDTRVRDDEGRFLAESTRQVTNSHGSTVEAKYLDEEGYYVNENGFRYTENGQYIKGSFQYQDAEGNPITDAAKQTTGNLVKGAEAVTFSSSADTSKIIDAIKSMVNDYNEMANMIKDAYSTLPQERSGGEYYEPLTEEDKEGLSESTIEDYETKAKEGLLFGDRDLSTLYDRLRSAISLSGQIGADMRAIGITVAYSDGKTTLSLDEGKLQAALESDPDKVQSVFTDADNGLMQSLKEPLDDYAKTIGTKGILVQKAGSVLAPTSLYQNTLQSELDDIDDEIAKWEEKLTDKVDYYTSQFSLLEQLVAQMNSQSSMLAGLTGGY